MPTYADFNSFAIAVRSHSQSHPDWIRLNGQTSGGDQNAWAEFWHLDRRWKVDADTQFSPILVAYEHWLSTGENPFQIEESPKRYCLAVIASVRDLLVQLDVKYDKNKYFYAYSKRQTANV